MWHTQNRHLANIPKKINCFSCRAGRYHSGFRPNCLTTSALLKLINDVFSALDSGDLTGAIFIDLRKAFDLVDHYLLLDKLYAVGLSQNTVL